MYLSLFREIPVRHNLPNKCYSNNSNDPQLVKHLAGSLWSAKNLPGSRAGWEDGSWRGRRLWQTWGRIKMQSPRLALLLWHLQHENAGRWEGERARALKQKKTALIIRSAERKSCRETICIFMMFLLYQFFMFFHYSVFYFKFKPWRIDVT